MSRRRFWSLAMILGMAFLRSGSLCAQEIDKTASKLSVDYGRDIRPLLTKYCFSCHGSKKASAALNLESLQGQEILTKPRVWKKVWERVRTHQMPPPERAHPTFADRPTNRRLDRGGFRSCHARRSARSRPFVRASA